jgi:hypothetical protein
MTKATEKKDIAIVFKILSYFLAVGLSVSLTAYSLILFFLKNNNISLVFKIC